MSSYVDYYTDDKGELFIKYFLIDDSFNARGWSVDPSVIPRLAKNAIGKPFTDYRDSGEDGGGDSIGMGNSGPGGQG